MNATVAGRNSQSGAVLIVALIFLAIMATLAASSIQTTTTNERIAGSVRDKSTAFQAAETTLKAAEDFVLTTTAVFFATGATPTIAGLYPATVTVSGVTTDSWRYVDQNNLWSDNTAVAIYSIGGNYLSNILAAPPSYIIEEIKSFSTPSGGGPPTASTYYRVTARAVGLTPNSEVVLQSTFIK
jgi:type IV pilus assembly protein PilX